MKILAVCGHGLGSSFMVEMNIKKVLAKYNVSAEVGHADVASVNPNDADLFVMTKDLVGSSSLPSAKLVALDNIIDLNILEAALKPHLIK